MTSTPTTRTNKPMAPMAWRRLACGLLLALPWSSTAMARQDWPPLAAQMGAYTSAQAAAEAWFAVPEHVRGQLAPPVICTAATGARTMVRLLLPADTLDERAVQCARLRGAGLGCLPQDKPCDAPASPVPVPTPVAASTPTPVAASTLTPVAASIPAAPEAEERAVVAAFTAPPDSRRALEGIEYAPVPLDLIERTAVGGLLAAAPQPAPPPPPQATRQPAPPSLPPPPVEATPADPAEALDLATRAVRAGDHARAARLLAPLAEAGDPLARHNLALLYGAGKGVPRDDARAFTLMRAAAEAGLSSAQNTLGVMYLHGKGTARDLRQAIHWLNRAADAGHVLARENLRAIAEASVEKVAVPEKAASPAPVTGRSGATAPPSAHAPVPLPGGDPTALPPPGASAATGRGETVPGDK